MSTYSLIHYKKYQKTDMDIVFTTIKKLYGVEPNVTYDTEKGAFKLYFTTKDKVKIQIFFSFKKGKESLSIFTDQDCYNDHPEIVYSLFKWMDLGTKVCLENGWCFFKESPIVTKDKVMFPSNGIIFKKNEIVFMYCCTEEDSYESYK